MRRLYAFLVTGEMIAQFCRNGEHAFTVEGPVPDTARFFCAHFDHARNAFVCIFEDDSFDEVAEGEYIPLGIGPTLKSDTPEEPCEDNEPENV